MLSKQLSGLENQLDKFRKKINVLRACAPTQAEATVGHIRLTLSLNKTSYGLGENVNITLRLTNEGNETASLTRSSPPLLEFVIYDETSPIYASPPGVLPFVVNLLLNPGESFSMDLTWNQQVRYVYPDYEQVEPGIYCLLGRTTPFASVNVGEQEIEKIETPKIPIEII